MLTGNAKIEFEKWFVETLNKELDLTILEDFYTYPFSMQFGVYIDFFDSKNLIIVIDRDLRDKFPFGYCITQHRTWTKYSIDTRYNARIKAIEKANEIFNSNINS